MSAKGFLEVGISEQNEVIVNHPDLMPDENGVGHIVFSVSQAQHFAHSILNKASEAAARARRQEEEAKRKAAEATPVDRSAVTLTDGSPVTPDHRELRENGQQKGYVVLSDAERAKGFVRPVRRSYMHVGIRPKYPLRELTEDERRDHPNCGYVAYEEYPESESPMCGRYWTKAQLESGCGTVTTMGQSIAETYARDPKFYGGTFCCGCGKHFPVEEFEWMDGSGERVGS